MAVVLTRKLTLETPQRVPDGAGGFTETWVALGTLWADVQARSGREAAGPGAVVSRAGYKITVRAAPEGSDARPRPDQRFREGTRLFLIEGVVEKDRAGRFLTCFAEEETIA